MKKGFDINKHKHFQTPMEYIQAFYEGQYIYTIEDIANILDMKEQYIQIKFMDKLDTLYIDKFNKLNIRGILNDYKKEPYLIPEEYRDAVETMLVYKDKLRKRVLISYDSVIELIRTTFKKEVKINIQGDIELQDLTPDDINLILDKKLNSTRSSKELLGCNHDTQLYRELAKKLHLKYIIQDESKKHNTARYLFL